jgi:V/A-type H+/Na+-transporting ATPase subunit E
MSLDTVVEDIQEEARARAEEIRAEAEAEAAEIVAEAEADAEEIEERRAREVEREIEQEREQRLSSAKLEAKQERLAARRDVLADVYAEVEDEIASLSGERRELLTRELLDAALTEYDTGDTVRVYGRAEDEALIESLVDETAHDATYAGERECLGGVVVESDESRVRVNNTFDSVLDDVWEDVLREASETLFEER